MKIHAIVFYDSEQLQPLEYKIYDTGSNKYEQRFITEFVNFSRKDFLKKMNKPSDEFVLTFVDGAVLVYITETDDVGVVMVISSAPDLNTTPHIVSRKLINDYIKYDMIPNSANDILTYFKHKEILLEVQETKKVLLRTISKVMERGEKIEELVDKTDELSTQSKLFFKHSRKLNSCCWIFSSQMVIKAIIKLIVIPFIYFKK